MTDELALLARARRLENDALAEVHQTYYEAIYRYMTFRVGDRMVADDLTSEVFTRLLSALRDHTAPQNTLRGWLYGVAARVVSDHFRRRGRVEELELAETIVSRAVSPEEAAEVSLSVQDLRVALTQLTEDQQRVLSLRYGAGLPVREVAELLGKSEGAIKQLQLRAVAALAHRLSSGAEEA